MGDPIRGLRGLTPLTSSTPSKIRKDEPAAPQTPGSDGSDLSRRTTLAPASGLRAKLSLMRKPDKTAPPVVLAEMDLAGQVEARNVHVPSMTAKVSIENASVLKGYGGHKEKLVLQHLSLTAFEALKTATAQVSQAVQAFDKLAGDQPQPSSEARDLRDAELGSMCKKVALAQEAEVQAAVAQEWQMQRKRDKAYTKMNLKFAAKLTLNATSLATNATVLGMSLGVSLPRTIISMAKTTLSTAMLVADFAADRDAVAKDVLKLDQTLSGLFDQATPNGSLKASGRDVLVAVGTPFLHSTSKMEKALEDFLGKSGRAEREAQGLYKQANELMDKLKEIDVSTLDANKRAKAEKMSEDVGTMLNTVADLAESLQADNTFYTDYKERCKGYREGVRKEATGAVGAYGHIDLVNDLRSLSTRLLKVVDALV